jgi:GTP-binding protein
MNIESVELRATVADHRKGPREPFPQVAFAGRSNVGKSSLLNTLFMQRLALVSKQPGKTRTINYFLVNRNLYLVDLPGYGYAKVPQREREMWGERVASYIRDEGRLHLVVGLIDPRIPTSPLDIELANFVTAVGKDLLIVLTKADQLGRGALASAAARIRRDLELEEAPLPFSAKTGAGKRELMARIAGAATARGASHS